MMAVMGQLGIDYHTIEELKDNLLASSREIGELTDRIKELSKEVAAYA
jgi:hypothetical protein